jgi:hypothetical protein
LETDEEVVTAFVYNDLQQVRAGIVDSVEASDYSAIQRQIAAHARQAFHDVHGREPHADADADGEELEQLEALFANCFLSPIESGGPLLTVKEEPPPSELVLPQGYLFEQGESVSTEADGEQDELEDSCEPEQSCDPQPRRRGRPRRQRSRKIHRRLHKRLRRRASSSSILGIPWEQYYELLKRLVKLELAARLAGGPAPKEHGPPGAVADSCSPTSFYRHVREFTSWLQGAAARLPQQLAACLLPRPRGDPEAPDLPSD